MFSAQFDICYLIDNSFHRRKSFGDIQAAVIESIAWTDYGPNRTHIGAIQYSRHADIIVPLQVCNHMINYWI